MKLRKAIEKAGGWNDLIVSVLIGVWMIYQLIASYSLPVSNYDPLGSSGYARIVSGLGLLCVVIYLAQKCVAIARACAQITEEESKAAQKEQAAAPRLTPLAWVRTHYQISMLILCILFVFSIDKVGFIVASALYLLISMLLFSTKEDRNLLAIAILTAAFSWGIYAVFRYAFVIILP